MASRRTLQKNTMQTINPHHLQHDQNLPKSFRTQLENTVKAAREVAEGVADVALHQLAVSEARVPEYLSEK